MQTDTLLRNAGLKVTQNRLNILDALTTLTKPVTVKELNEWLSQNHQSIDQVTLYRTVETLHQKGIIEKIDFRQGAYRYELQTNHHHHLVCQSCHKIEELTDEAVEINTKKIIQKTYYLITDHSLELYGICPACQPASKTKN